MSDELGLPGFDEMYTFLQRWYKSDRFATKDAYMPGHSRRLTYWYLESLQRDGVAFITHHESATGRAIYFDKGLRILSEAEVKAYWDRQRRERRNA